MIGLLTLFSEQIESQKKVLYNNMAKE